MLFAEFVEVELCQGGHASVLGDQLASNFNGAGTLCSGAEEDGEKLFVGKRAGTEARHFLPGTLLVGEIMDAGILWHLMKESIDFSSGRGKLSVMKDEGLNIVFFDSDCLMCQGAVKWLHRLDAQDQLRFAPLQGETAKTMGVSLDEDSMAFYSEGEVSRAALAVERLLIATGGVAALAGVSMKVFPLSLRNWCYRQIAKLRLTISKSISCGIPEEGLMAKMLE